MDEGEYIASAPGKATTEDADAEVFLGPWV